MFYVFGSCLLALCAIVAGQVSGLFQSEPFALFVVPAVLVVGVVVEIIKLGKGEKND